MSTGPYLISLAASATFLAAWLWYFLPDISMPEGLVGVVLALVLRHLLYRGLGGRRGD